MSTRQDCVCLKKIGGRNPEPPSVCTGLAPQMALAQMGVPWQDLGGNQTALWQLGPPALRGLHYHHHRQWAQSKLLGRCIDSSNRETSATWDKGQTLTHLLPLSPIPNEHLYAVYLHYTTALQCWLHWVAISRCTDVSLVPIELCRH